MDHEHRTRRLARLVTCFRYVSTISHIVKLYYLNGPGSIYRGYPIAPEVARNIRNTNW